MSNPYLAAVRAAHIERVDAAYDRDQDRERSLHGFAGLPYSLISAGCWLVHNGYDGAACRAELATGWGPSRYRQYLAGLSPEALEDELRDGRAALFEGRRPIFAERLRDAA